MWNPDTYRDSDFGLDPDESFEPRDDVDDEYRPGPGEPVVTTVLGPIRPDEVGLALVREHLQWVDGGDRLDDRMAALADLEAFFTVSGRTVVSATPVSAGRDARALRWIAQRAPVHIVAATGYVDGGKVTSEREVREGISLDLDVGMDGSGALPGVAVTGDPDDALTGAAIVELGERYRDRELAVISLAPASRQRAAVERLDAAGVPAGRVIVADSGNVAPHDIAPILEGGAWLLFDGIGVDHQADRDLARRVVEIVAGGNGGRLLLSHGFRSRSQLTGYQGRPGLAYVVEQFAVMLLEEGLEALDVRRMLVDNVAVALTTVAAVTRADDSHREGR